MRTVSRPRLLAAAILVAAALGACSSSADSQSVLNGGESGSSDSLLALETEGEAAPGDPGTPSLETAEDREVITTGSLTLVTDDVASAAREITELTDAAGGHVEEHSETNDETFGPSARLVVRIPASETSAAMDSFGKLGTVEETLIEATDVTTTARDLDARISALETSTARLESLMADATTTEDLLAAERELASRQAELESFRSQRTLLADQVAMSTLTIHVQTSQAPDEDDADGFVDGLRSGWEALVTTVQVVVLAIGMLLPWLLVAALVWLLVRWALRSRRARREARPETAPPSPLPHSATTPARETESTTPAQDDPAT